MFRHLAHTIQFAALTALVWLIRIMPHRMQSRVGAGLGQFVYFLGIRKAVTRDNLALAFPTLPKHAVRDLSAQVYRHMGRVATSIVSLPQLSRAAEGKWIFIEGWDALDAALREGKGVIVASGHLGNWEIMGSMVARCGYPVTFVVAAQSNERVEDWLDNWRNRAGIETIKRRDAVRGVLMALKQNRIVAMLIDQDAHEDGAFVPFFGRLASAPRGPAVFHLRTGAPVIFASSIHLPGDKYKIRLVRVIPEPNEDADALTARMTKMLEDAIRETPEQWLWMHRRWKTRPPAL
jgi:Kdo2-lipid IVA lauroyltransferase/acyltransferase